MSEMLCTAILPAVSTHLLFVVLILFPLQYIKHTHTYTHTHTHTSIFNLKKEALPFPWPASSTPLIPASRLGPQLPLAHNPAKSNMASMGHSHLS